MYHIISYEEGRYITCCANIKVLKLESLNKLNMWNVVRYDFVYTWANSKQSALLIYKGIISIITLSVNICIIPERKLHFKIPC